MFDPTNTSNPDIRQDQYLQFENPMQQWLSGMERQVALVYGAADLDNEREGLLTVYHALASDNYVNTETFFNQNFDNLALSPQDDDIDDILFALSDLREAAQFGQNEVAAADEDTSPNDLAELQLYEGLANLLLGENFVAAPPDSAAAPVAPEQLHQNAIALFESALGQASEAQTEYALRIFLARTHRNLGNETAAREQAQAVIDADRDFVRYARFDNAAGPTNLMQNALFDRGSFDDLQPLPRLDFLDPKFYQGAFPNTVQGDDADADIALAKAEEAFLIKAEVQIAQGDLPGARQTMKNLLDVIEERKTSSLSDEIEQRRFSVNPQGVASARPDSTNWRVAASPDDTLRSGLVRDRGANAIPFQVPVISGTSVTDDIIDDQTTEDGALELLYLMRQEIFIGEGRRAADLGIRLPLTRNERTLNPNIDAGDDVLEGFVPAYIPTSSGIPLLDFCVVGGEASGCAYPRPNDAEAVILVNMNEVLVENKSEALPFF